MVWLSSVFWWRKYGNSSKFLSRGTSINLTDGSYAFIFVSNTTALCAVRSVRSLGDSVRLFISLTGGHYRTFYSNFCRSLKQPREVRIRACVRAKCFTCKVSHSHVRHTHRLYDDESTVEQCANPNTAARLSRSGMYARAGWPI